VKTLYLIRGLPGSGKSTLAATLKASFWSKAEEGCGDPEGYPSVCEHFETDQYFTDSDGVYRWSGDRLLAAHAWCRKKTMWAMIDGVENIIVANVFAIQSHIQHYLELAQVFGYKVQIILCQGNFGNVHGVPEETIQRMKGKFQYAIEIRNVAAPSSA